MATIRPFKGIRFSPSLIKDLGKVITPPYDVIDAVQQELLHQKSPYNIVRLEYGKAFSKDTEFDNKYKRAHALLHGWLNEGVINIDSKPLYYLYEQHYFHGGKNYCRKAIICALRVEPYSAKVILPHELTMSAPKADRLELLSSLQANTSPIFTLFPDPEERIDYFFDPFKGAEPDAASLEENGQYHRLFLIENPLTQQEITDYLASQPLLIADGHHRYETALSYAAEKEVQGQPGSSYVLAALVSMKDPGLLVLPTHRLIATLTDSQKDSLRMIIENEFRMIKICNTADLEIMEYQKKLEEISLEKQVIGFITPELAGYLLLKDINTADRALPVSILHNKILKPLLAPGEASEIDKSMITYPHELESVITALKGGNADAAFILNTVAVDEILKRAEQDEIMPQKTTFFYPKLPGGLVIHHHSLSY